MQLALLPKYVMAILNSRFVVTDAFSYANCIKIWYFLENQLSRSPKKFVEEFVKLSQYVSSLKFFSFMQKT